MARPSKPSRPRIVARSYTVYLNHCHAHKLNPSKDAVYIDRAAQLAGLEGGELVLSHGAETQREYQEILHVAITKSMTIVRRTF